MIDERKPKKNGRPTHGRRVKRRITLRMSPQADRIGLEAAEKFRDTLESERGVKPIGNGLCCFLQAALEESRWANRFADLLEAAGL